VSESKQPEKTPDGKPLTGRQAYNLVTDTMAGPNVRWRDNLFQGLAILVCLALGALVGALVAADRLIGALTGGFLGLVAGLFLSGLVLMIYRAVQHARGRHD
jgi:hypothetical protein